MIQGPDGTPIVQLNRASGIEKVSFQLPPSNVLGNVQAENKTFVFHGETKVDKVRLYPKQGALAQAGVTYRLWSHIEPGSAKADGKVSLAAAPPYPWFAWKKGSTASSLPIQVNCAELGLSPGSSPAHFARSQGGAFVRSSSQLDFRDLATGPVTARIMNPFNPAASAGTDNDMDVLVLGKTANGKLTQVDMRIGEDLSAIGWIPSTALRPALAAPSTMGQGPAEAKPSVATGASYTYRRCNMNVPLWAVVPGPNPNDPTGRQPRIVEFGYVKSGRPFRGAPLPNGDFRVDVGDNDKWSDKVVPADTLDPFVSKESLVTVGCGEIPAASYDSP